MGLLARNNFLGDSFEECNVEKVDGFSNTNLKANNFIH